MIKLNNIQSPIFKANNKQSNMNASAPITNEPTKVASYNVSNLQANSNISFKGANYYTSLEKYVKDTKENKQKPLDSFLNLDASKETMSKLLTEILSNDNLRDSFVEDLTNVPRLSRQKHKDVCEKIDNPQIMESYNPYSEYSKAYNTFLNNKLNNAKCIEPLLKHRPDWKESVLLEKFKNVRGHDDFKIGNIPKEFPNDNFGQVYNHLKGYMQGGSKQTTKIPSLNLTGRNYDLEYYTDGKSLKNVYKVETCGKKFIFKIDKEENRSLNDPFALGTLALIDNYLTLHRCRNSAPILYYNHACNTSIYKYIEHNHVQKKLNNASEVNRKLPDFQDLGMCYNDTVGINNYFELKRNSSDECLYDMQYGIDHNEYISVDNDHVTYSNITTPMTPLNKYLPNTMDMAF